MVTSSSGIGNEIEINTENVEDELERLHILDGYDSDEHEFEKVRISSDGIDMRAMRASLPTEFSLDENQEINFKDENEDKEPIDYAKLYQFRNMDMIRGEDDGLGNGSEMSLAFDVLRKSMIDVSESQDCGIMKKVIIPGIGPLIKKGTLVRINYNAFFELNDEPFDSSYLRKKPFEFIAGTNEVIIGLKEAILTMKKHEKSQFIFSHDNYLGEQGCLPRVPSNTPVLFEIKVESTQEINAYNEFQMASPEQRLEFSFERITLIANCLRQLGNDLYERGMYRDACSRYHKAIYILDKRSAKNEQEDIETKRILLKLFLNMSQVALKQQKPKKCIYYCKQALIIDSSNTKALFRYGKAMRLLQDFDRAYDYLKKALKHEPLNKEITLEMEKLNDQFKKQKIIQNELYKKMICAESKLEINVADKNNNNISQATKDLILNQLNEFKNDQLKKTFKIDCHAYAPDVIQYLKSCAHKLNLGTREITGVGYTYTLKCAKSHLFFNSKPRAMKRCT